MLITLLILALVFGLFWWALQQIPLPQPVRAVVIVVFVLIAAIYLLGMIPGGHVPRALI